MNKEWSMLNKEMQEQLKKESTYLNGIETLLVLRNSLFNNLLDIKKKLTREEFNAIPFLNTKGYHNKTVTYSIWHIFRIEDIVLHSLIKNDEEVFFKNDYKKRINSPIITTGNELKGLEIFEFSKQLDIDELYKYANEVKTSTEEMLLKLSFDDLKKKFKEEDKDRLKTLGVVSDKESANWLIDYWCSKNIKGLIGMPFSRHWIMHVEACSRIKDKILD